VGNLQGVDMSRQYVARCGAVQIKPSHGALLQAAQAQNNTGFCLACGEEMANIEPDARRAECESCGALKVYGAEDLLVRGLYHTGAA